jgi:hypothetical protein
MDISFVKHQWLEAVVLSYQEDAEAMKLLSQLAAQPDSVPNYTLVQGIIRYRDRLWLGSSKVTQQNVLKAFHSSPMGGHSGAPATYCRIKRLFYWQGMKVDVWSFVCACIVCLQASQTVPDIQACCSRCLCLQLLGKLSRWLKGFQFRDLQMLSWSWWISSLNSLISLP